MKKALSIAVIGGVRPQFIKCAALQRAIVNYNLTSQVEIAPIFINSGQHYDDDLSGVFIRELNIHFDHTIVNVNKASAQMLGNMITCISDILLVANPSWVVIFGDANTTLAGALAANKSKFPIAHFEAGTAIKDLRTPEVTNGKLVSHLATLQFCSSELAADSLKKMGITENVFIVGDIARDFVIEFSKSLPAGFDGLEPGSYILLTLHREENLESDSILPIILNTISVYSKVVFSIHPRTKQKLEALGLLNVKNVIYTTPLSYKKMLSAIKGSRCVVTDSGGIQREAYYLMKRCLICSKVDFWPSLRLANVHKIIEPNVESIKSGFRWLEFSESIAYPRVNDLDQTNVAKKSLDIIVEKTNSNPSKQN